MQFGNPRTIHAGMRLFVAAALLCVSVGQAEVLAQNPFAPKKKYDNDNEYVPENATTPPDMPYLPPYAAQGTPVYSNILSWKRQKDGPAYSLTFHVKEEAPEVIGFYKNAFKDNKWQEQQANSSKMLSYMRGNCIASVVVMKPVLKGYKSQVYLTYKMFVK